MEDAQEDVVGLVEDLDNLREIPDTNSDLVLSTVTDLPKRSLSGTTDKVTAPCSGPVNTTAF